MKNPNFLPNTRSTDSVFGEGGLLDRMFDASFPWKVLRAVNDASPVQTSTFFPSIDVKSDDKAYTVHAEVPGVKKDDIQLEVHDGILILKGEKKEEISDNKTAHVIERRFGSFERSMRLPDDADVDSISATHADGVLIVTIPRIVSKENKKSIAITSTDA